MTAKGQPVTEHNPISAAISAALAALDGLRVPGGCDSCDAYQVLEAHAYGQRDVHVIHVCHDKDCPELARRTA
jgi:hypothetical protein